MSAVTKKRFPFNSSCLQSKFLRKNPFRSAIVTSILTENTTLRNEILFPVLSANCVCTLSTRQTRKSLSRQYTCVHLVKNVDPQNRVA